MRCDPVGDRLDRRFRVDRDDTHLDEIGRMRADDDEASNSPYCVSWIDFTHPPVVPDMTARAFATNGKTPTATRSPWRSRACASVKPTPAISGSV